MRKIMTITSNQNFRESLTAKEAQVWDAVRNSNGRGTRQELANQIGMSASTFSRLYWEAQYKFTKLATRSEM